MTSRRPRKALDGKPVVGNFLSPELDRPRRKHPPSSPLTLLVRALARCCAVELVSQSQSSTPSEDIGVVASSTEKRRTR